MTSRTVSAGPCLWYLVRCREASSCTIGSCDCDKAASLVACKDLYMVYSDGWKCKTIRRGRQLQGAGVGTTWHFEPLLEELS